MSAAKITRGPWVAVEVGQGGPADAPMPVYEIHADNGRAVVAEYVDGHNAHLIASAPDLLGALNLLISAYDPEDDFAELKVARAAIAKATGSAS